MKSDLAKTIAILERTPSVLTAMLKGLPDEWVMNNEGLDTFSPYDVVGHLLHGEKADWPDRVRMIIEHGPSKTFIPYDRFAMYEESKGKSLAQLLEEFAVLRKKNVEWLQSLQLTDEDLGKKGMHPNFGEVTQDQLISTWAVHDLTHIAQIGRVMAKQYKTEIGPWSAFFRVLEF
jgi:hypothetical protein